MVHHRNPLKEVSMNEYVYVLFADYKESGMARKVRVPAGTTMNEFLEEHVGDLDEGNVKVTLNGLSCTGSQLIEAPEGSEVARVSLSQTNTKGNS